MKNNYCVYKHTFPDGKVYIGVTMLPPEKRWRYKGRGYLYSNKKMYLDIKKLDWDNEIKHDILFENLSKKDAWEKEVELVNFYNSTDPEKGYNKSPGGNKMTEENRKKLSEKRIEGLKNGTVNLYKIAVKKFSLKGVFIKEYPSIREALIDLGKNTYMSSCISDSCKNIYSSAFGYLWRYSKEYPENNNIEQSEIMKLKRYNYKKIKQLSLDGKLIKIWPSIKEAAANMPPLFKNNASKLSFVLTKRRKTNEAFGFLWEYDEDSGNIPEKVV